MRKSNSIILAIFLVLFSFTISYALFVMGGQVRGPMACQSLSPSAINYFPVLNNFGFTMDNNGDMFISDNLNLRWNIVRVNNIGCGGWFGTQTLITNGSYSVPYSYSDDKNQPTHFFESGDFYGAGVGGGLWRVAKDGSSRVQIFTYGAGTYNAFGGDFDVLADRYVVTVDNPSPIGWVIRISRLGAVTTWNILGAFGYQPRGVGVFADGRYVLGGGNILHLYSGWGGVELQQIANPLLAVSWISCDNANNRVYVTIVGRTIVWDIPTNTIVANHVWGAAATAQVVAYSDGWAYTKDSDGGIPPSDFRMWRWNFSTGVEESWDGSQFLF